MKHITLTLLFFIFLSLSYAQDENFSLTQIARGVDAFADGFDFDDHQQGVALHLLRYSGFAKVELKPRNPYYIFEDYKKEEAEYKEACKNYFNEVLTPKEVYQFFQIVLETYRSGTREDIKAIRKYFDLSENERSKIIKNAYPKRSKSEFEQCKFEYEKQLSLKNPWEVFLYYMINSTPEIRQKTYHLLFSKSDSLILNYKDLALAKMGAEALSVGKTNIIQKENIKKWNQLKETARPFLITAIIILLLGICIYICAKIESAKKSIKLKNKVPITEIIRNVFARLYALSALLFIIPIWDRGEDLPYAYFMLTRLIVCGICVYSAVKFKLEWAKWIFGGLAVLYNPVIPIHLGERDAWIIVNILTAVFMWTILFFETKRAES